MEYLQDYTLKTLRLKPDKWSRMLVSDEQRTFVNAFIDRPGPQVNRIFLTLFVGFSEYRVKVYFTTQYSVYCFFLFDEISFMMYILIMSLFMVKIIRLIIYRRNVLESNSIITR